MNHAQLDKKHTHHTQTLRFHSPTESNTIPYHQNNTKQSNSSQSETPLPGRGKSWKQKTLHKFLLNFTLTPHCPTRLHQPLPQNPNVWLSCRKPYIAPPQNGSLLCHPRPFHPRMKRYENPTFASADEIVANERDTDERVADERVADERVVDAIVADEIEDLLWSAWPVCQETSPWGRSRPLLIVSKSLELGVRRGFSWLCGFSWSLLEVLVSHCTPVPD